MNTIIMQKNLILISNLPNYPKADFVGDTSRDTFVKDNKLQL